jgi:hypothetical protein
MTYPWSDPMLAGRKINIRNTRQIPIIDNRLILAIPVEDMGEEVSKTIHKF